MAKDRCLSLSAKGKQEPDLSPSFSRHFSEHATIFTNILNTKLIQWNTFPTTTSWQRSQIAELEGDTETSLGLIAALDEEEKMSKWWLRDVYRKCIGWVKDEYRISKGWAYDFRRMCAGEHRVETAFEHLQTQHLFYGLANGLAQRQRRGELDTFSIIAHF